MGRFRAPSSSKKTIFRQVGQASDSTELLEPDGGNRRACKFGVPAYEPGREVLQMTPESASLRMLTLSAWSWSEDTLSVALELPVLTDEDDD
jgi:hypothetical protein